MSRSGYSDEYDDGNGALAMYRGMVASASRGKRGQALFRDILIALNAMPERRLIAHELEDGGAVCAIGAAGRLRGVDMSGLDPDDAETVADRFNIANCLAREVVYMNDEEWTYPKETPAERYERMRKWVRSQIKDPLFDVVWC